VSKIVETANKMNEFVVGDDGFVMYWPAGFAGGGFSAWHLRELADELDRRNEAWQADLDRYFKEETR